MAIQPIDLQTLYTQIDKVGKQVAFQQQGQHLKNAVNNSEFEKQLIEKHKAVSEATMEDSETGTVKERRNPNQQETSSNNEQSKNQEETSEQEKNLNKSNVINDPTLGRYIDISG